MQSRNEVIFHEINKAPALGAEVLILSIFDSFLYNRIKQNKRVQRGNSDLVQACPNVIRHGAGKPKLKFQFAIEHVRSTD